MHRYWFDVAGLAVACAAVAARRLLRAAARAYVRRLDANGECDNHGDDANENGSGRE